MTPTQLVLIATNAATQGIEKYSTGRAEIIFQTRRLNVDFGEEVTVDTDCRIWQRLVAAAVHTLLRIPLPAVSLRPAIVENCSNIPLVLSAVTAGLGSVQRKLCGTTASEKS